MLDSGLALSYYVFKFDVVTLLNKRRKLDMEKLITIIMLVVMLGTGYATINAMSIDTAKNIQVILKK